MSRINAPLLLIMLLSSLLLTACGGGENNVSKGNREGILHWGNAVEPQELDPHIVSGVSESRILRALFEGLVINNSHTLVPEPATVGKLAPTVWCILFTPESQQKGQMASR